MTAPKNTISVSAVKDLLSYDAESGSFRRIVATSWNAPEGPLVGKLSASGYRTVRIGERSIFLHRIAWAIYYGSWPDFIIDHINGDRSDNRISNLRNASLNQNQHNQGIRKTNSSGVKGVSWCASKHKWLATICVKGKTIYLGRHDTIDGAADAYRMAALEFHGTFARFS